MNGNQDLHQALKVDKVAGESFKDASAVVTRMQSGKDSVRFAAHVYPNGWSTAGLQLTDVLAYLGFNRSSCTFASHECYARWVPDSFDLKAFGDGLERVRQELLAAERELQLCGFRLPQPEGWGYYHGRPSGYRRSNDYWGTDGHTASEVKMLKQSECQNFRFVLSFLTAAHLKGWTLHVFPKRDLRDLGKALPLLKLKQFKECPQGDFQPCMYRFDQKQQSHAILDQQTQFVNHAFDQLSAHLTPGLQHIVNAEMESQRLGLDILSAAQKF